MLNNWSYCSVQNTYHEVNQKTYDISNFGFDSQQNYLNFECNIKIYSFSNLYTYQQSFKQCIQKSMQYVCEYFYGWPNRNILINVNSVNRICGKTNRKEELITK